jgi:hypothetical protein
MVRFVSHVAVVAPFIHPITHVRHSHVDLLLLLM